MRHHATALALAASALLASTAQAAVLPTDGSWASFIVDGNVPPNSLGWVDDVGASLSFTFNVPVGSVATLTVVDAGFSGDSFSVFDGAALLGNTNSVANGDTTGPSIVNFDAALANNSFSRGVFVLGEGNHTITGNLLDSASDAFGPLNATLGGVKVSISAVPEPSQIATLLAGLGLIGLVLRRRTV